jgi:carbon-monoxide dehydrogenase large subunit
VAGDQTRTIADVAMYAHGSGELPPGVEGGLDAQTVFRD